VKTLKKILFDEYKGFSDKRITNLDRGTRFTIDDRGEHDHDAKGELYLWFCTMHADVLSPPAQLTLGGQHRTDGPAIDAVRVLLGNVPKSHGVRAWITANSATVQEAETRSSLEFDVIKGKQGILRDLAAAIRAIVAPGAGYYEVDSYKYVCPRTAASLERLAKTLDSAWSK
jgi:hypothetical protein